MAVTTALHTRAEMRIEEEESPLPLRTARYKLPPPKPAELYIRAIKKKKIALM